MTGKGSKPRPLSIPRAEFADKWDKIFKREKKENDGSTTGQPILESQKQARKR